MDDLLTGARRVPVYLLTGFLGSGKTTLLNALLAEGVMPDTAIVVNEFGAVGIDQHLIRRVDEHVVLLRDGCLCCEVRTDLVQTLRELFVEHVTGVAQGGLARVVIETSGLADPVPIVHTMLADPALRERFLFAGTIATVDATTDLAALCRRPEGVRQVTLADRIVLTKGDLAGREAVHALGERLRVLNPDAVVEGGGATQAAALAARLGRGDPVRTPGERRGGEHAGVARPTYRAMHGVPVAACVLRAQASVDWDDFVAWFGALLDPSRPVLRVKGVLDVTGQPLPIVVQAVQNVAYPAATLPAWPDDDRRSRLVVIAENPRGLSRAALFDALLPASALWQRDDVPAAAAPTPLSPQPRAAA